MDYTIESWIELNVETILDGVLYAIFPMWQGLNSNFQTFMNTFVKRITKIFEIFLRINRFHKIYSILAS